MFKTQTLTHIQIIYETINRGENKTGIIKYYKNKIVFFVYIYIQSIKRVLI